MTLVGVAIGASLFAWQADQSRKKAEDFASAESTLRREADDKRAEADRERREAEKQKGIVEEQSTSLKAALSRADRAQLLADRHLYAAHLNLVQREWENASIGRAWQLLDRYRTAKPDRPDLRGFEWHHWSQLCHSALVELPGPTTIVYSLAFSPDGKHVASTGSQGGLPETLSVWDVATGKRALRLVGHQDGVDKVAFSPDGRWIATASKDKTVRLWNARDGREIRRVTVVDTCCLLISPDSQRLITADCSDKKFVVVRVWDVDTGDQRRSFQVGSSNSYLRAGAIDSTGRYLALGGGAYSSDQPGRLFLCDLEKGEKILEFRGHRQAIVAAAFCPDGYDLAAAGSAGAAYVWDRRSGQLLTTLRGHKNEVRGLAYSPDGRILASGETGLIKFWNRSTGEELRTVRGEIDGFVAFSPDGCMVASGGGSTVVSSVSTSVSGKPDNRAEDDDDEPKGSISLWDATSSQEHRSLRLPYMAQDLAFSPNQPIVAAASRQSSNDTEPRKRPRGQVDLWDLRTFQPLKAAPGAIPDVSCLAYSPRGDSLAIGAVGESILIWDTARGEFRQHWKETHGKLDALAYSPDGRWLVSAGGNPRQGLVIVWDTRTGTRVHRLTDHESYVREVAFHPASQWFASACWDRTVIVWDVATGTRVKLLEPFGPKNGPGGNLYVDSVAFSPDGHFLACGGDDGVVIWDVKSWERVLALGGKHVAFNPNGKQLAVCNWQLVRIWDLPTGQQLASFPFGQNRITFNPDGKILATTDRDSIRLWDARVVKPFTDSDQRRIWEQRWRAWRRQQIGEAQSTGEWFAVAFHLSRLIAETPDDARLYAARASSYAEREMWREAASDLLRASKLQPAEIRYWTSRALLSVPLGDLAAHRKICDEMLERFGGTDDPAIANNLAWSCVLVRDAVANRDRLVALAEKAVARTPGEYVQMNTLGAALYRAGQFTRAIERLNEAVKLHADGGTAWDFYFLALAHEQLGQREESQNWLNKANAAMGESKAETPGAGKRQFTWNQRLELQHIARELDEIRKSAPAKPPVDKNE